MDLKFGPGARFFLSQQSTQSCDNLLDACIALRDNPRLSPDNATIIPFLAPPAVMRLFQDDFHWIIFYVSEFAQRVIIANIGDNAEAPHLWRSA